MSFFQVIDHFAFDARTAAGAFLGLLVLEIVENTVLAVNALAALVPAGHQLDFVLTLAEQA